MLETEALRSTRLRLSAFRVPARRSIALRTALLLAALAMAHGQAGALDARQGSPVDARTRTDQAELVDLDDLEDLRARFNEDEGTPRLILIVSPT